MKVSMAVIFVFSIVFGKGFSVLRVDEPNQTTDLKNPMHPFRYTS